MTFTAFILTLLSVLLHAMWNFLSKANRPSCAFYLLLNLVSVAVALPFALFLKISWDTLPSAFWLCLLGSIAFETLYSVGLFTAYKRLDISVAYPLMRSLPVVFTPIVTMLFRLGRMPGWLSLTGMFAIAAGCLLLQGFRFSRHSSLLSTQAVVPVLMASLGTTGYTILDCVATSHFLQASQASSSVTLVGYFLLVELGLSTLLALFVLLQPTERKEFSTVCLRIPSPYLCGVFNCGAYTLVLGAMRLVENVSYVQAFRQMALPLCAGMGVVFLKEKMSFAKALGILVILSGLVMTVI